MSDFHGATQHISFHRPLGPLIRRGVVQITTLTELELHASAKARWGQHACEQAMRACFESAWNQSSPMLVIFSRYGGPLVTHMLAAARTARVPVIAHFDDDLLGVPLELGPDKYRRYNESARLEAIRTVLEQSDLVYASTAALAARLRERGIQKPIVAGQIYCSGEPVNDVVQDRPAVVGYMGSAGHAHDLAIALPSIIRLLKDRPDLRFELFGTIPMPDGLRNYGARVVHHPPATDYEAFIRQLCELGWSIGLAPLADMPFNAVKANTKWVEYTTAGIAVIASDHPVYRETCAAGCGVLVENGGWYCAMTDLLADTSKRARIIAQARSHLQREFNSARLTAQLLSVFARVGIEFPVAISRVESSEPQPK